MRLALWVRVREKEPAYRCRMHAFQQAFISSAGVPLVITGRVCLKLPAKNTTIPPMICRLPVIPLIVRSTASIALLWDMVESKNRSDCKHLVPTQCRPLSPERKRRLHFEPARAPRSLSVCAIARNIFYVHTGEAASGKLVLKIYYHNSLAQDGPLSVKLLNVEFRANQRFDGHTRRGRCHTLTECGREVAAPVVPLHLVKNPMVDCL
ncbi:hypothetical protein EVAR_77854_1 [Eumeta japonica]|uniref:Uncharacterized protein n=1 Tax=Eumeta variegata TaxID=151549 RepID=A0A4C1TB68_EUMVA|nr:hypothetical protein EVAR_77854_1 [Eumeta japonica]